MRVQGEDRSVQDSVYTALRKSIINLNLLPGTAISEKEISLRYHVSRTPVREAFIHLSKEGLVEVIPQKETLVSLIDYARVEQELFLREHLEKAVLEHFVSKSGPEDFAKLEAFIEKQTQAFNNNDYVNFIMYDNDFHRVFFDQRYSQKHCQRAQDPVCFVQEEGSCQSQGPAGRASSSTAFGA